jgi:hypothetical protein
MTFVGESCTEVNPHMTFKSCKCKVLKYVKSPKTNTFATLWEIQPTSADTAYRYVNLMYYKQHSRLHVAATCWPSSGRFYVLLTVYNLVNKTNLVHNLFLVYLSTSTCFGQLWAHLQEKQLSFCDTWYLLFWVDDCLVSRVEWNRFPSILLTTQSSTQSNKYQMLQKDSCFSWWWVHSRPKHVEIDKYTKNKLCTKSVLFTRFWEFL